MPPQPSNDGATDPHRRQVDEHAARHPAEGGATAPVSSLAVLSLVFAIFPCIGSVPAIFLGAFAIHDVGAGGGKRRGRAAGIAGLALGILNLVGVAVAAPLFLFEEPGPPTLAPPVVAAPPTMTAHPPGAPPLLGGGDEGGQMSTLNEVVETQAGTIIIVDIPPSVRSLAAEVDAQRRKAAKAREKIVVYTITESCRPCMSVAAVMMDPRMQKALDHVRLLRVDIHDMGAELQDMGIQVKHIPGFYTLAPDLTASDGVTGAEWDDDTAENVSVVLGPFVRGHYTKRKENFKATPHPPGGPRLPARPAPTLLLTIPGDRRPVVGGVPTGRRGHLDARGRRLEPIATPDDARG
jgi:hypothetical protein